jgi:hypothetical protein
MMIRIRSVLIFAKTAPIAIQTLKTGVSNIGHTKPIAAKVKDSNQG